MRDADTCPPLSQFLHQLPLGRCPRSGDQWLSQQFGHSNGTTLTEGVDGGKTRSIVQYPSVCAVSRACVTGGVQDDNVGFVAHQRAHYLGGARRLNAELCLGSVLQVHARPAGQLKSGAGTAQLAPAPAQAKTGAAAGALCSPSPPLKPTISPTYRSPQRPPQWHRSCETPAHSRSCP